MISFENVSFTYEEPSSRTKKAARKQAQWGNAPDAPWALRDVSFTVDDGEFFGIAGHTGSGKSTLLQHMNGLLHPTSGRVLVDGVDLSDKRAAAQVRERVGLVFQYPERQLFAATVFEDVAFGPRNLGLSADEIEHCVTEALELVDLDPEALREKSPFELSGGQQRRVAFAGVLAMSPSTLVLDEPAAGLDPAARRDFLGLIAQLHAQQGTTVVMVSHNMDDLAALCDRILVLNEGKVRALGSPAGVFARPKSLEQVGLDLPAVQRLQADLARAGVSVQPRRGLHTLETLADALAQAYVDSGLQRSRNAKGAQAPGGALDAMTSGGCDPVGA